MSFRPTFFGCHGRIATETVIVGHFARDHGALIPDRLVTSAKSWLSNFHIDPKRAVLPWKSDMKEQKLSAFDCSRFYLEHLKEGFLYAERIQGRTWDLSEGQIVLTVPASFDEVARNLTAEAAEAAGLGKVVLLEEPQAAFYAWTAQAGSAWRSQVSSGDIVLVCDVGGGTADFSLIAISEKDGNLEVERISVGEHILLGGDNMDLALAYTLQAQLEAAGKSIDSWQFLALNPRCKPGQGEVCSTTNRLVKRRSRSLHADQACLPKRFRPPWTEDTLEQVVLDGFFPISKVTDLPTETRSTGLAGIRPALCVRSGRQQTSRQVPDKKLDERQSQRRPQGARRVSQRSLRLSQADRRAFQRRRLQRSSDPEAHAGSPSFLE